MNTEFPFLENPFDEISNKNDAKEINKKCEDIAKTLFEQYCLKCNNKEYYFVEIEFYYYEHEEEKKYEGGKHYPQWNKVTYPRENEAGDLLFHTSGVDICFKSSYNEKKFGGILVRAIMDKDENIIAGPWNCMLHILNECKGKNMPILEKISSKRYHKLNLQPTYRVLGEKDIELEKNSEYRLCWYDALPKEKWTFMKSSFKKDKGESISQKTYYKTDRFSI